MAINTALAALGGTFSAWHIGWDFVRAAGGGIVLGIIAALVLSQIRKRINDPVLDTALSFAAPYVAFVPAEEIHSSGVLSVVVAGLLLGHKAPEIQSATARIAENINWRTVQFLLENTVFLLIGLQLRDVLDAVADEHPSWGAVIGAAAAILVAAIAVRMLYVLLSVVAFKSLWPDGRGAGATVWSSAGPGCAAWSPLLRSS